MLIKKRNIYNNLSVQLSRSDRITDDAFKLEFRLKDGQFSFEAGQYIWLELNQLLYPDPRGNKRAFSIVSDPQKQDSIAIITRKSDSGFKRTLLALPIGSSVKITGPFGSFIVPKDKPKLPLYFIAGGTGVSPYLSLIKNLAASDSQPEINLVYSESSKEKFIPEVLSLRDNDKYKKFLKIFLNEGELSWDFLSNTVGVNQDSRWYFSGPKDMIHFMALTALENGIARDQMVFEEHYPYFLFENKIDLSTVDVFRLAVESSLIHVVITDVNGRIVYANQAASDTTGYSVDEMMGHTPRIWGGLMEPEFYRKLWHKIKNERKPFIGKIVNRKKSGEYYIAEISIAPIIARSPERELIGFAASEKDITEAERIDQEKSDFISIASHQLRTPLTGIRWATELLLKKKNIPSQESEYLTDIYSSTARLSELVDTLLNMTRIESGAIHIEPKTMDIIDFLSNYFRECSILFHEKDIDFVFHKPAAKLEVVTDESTFQNIVQSITHNAIEYTPEKGKIEVTLEKEDQSFILSIRDTGIGIPPEEQGRIFSKFFRADNARLVKSGGTGVGLYVANEAAKLLGGKIWFKSELNKGTIFYVELPLVSKAKDGAVHLNGQI